VAERSADDCEDTEMSMPEPFPPLEFTLSQTDVFEFTPRALEILSNLTLELVKIRQANCHHLIVENLAPEILAKLMLAVHRPVEYLSGEF